MKIILVAVHWLIIEFFGLHLILSPIIPGQAHIQVYIVSDLPALHENLMVQLMPVKFNGRPDYLRVENGSIDQLGSFSAIINFKWGEHRVMVRLYDKSQPSKSLIECFENISPYVRIGVVDKDIHL
jgi:hypothetical protein